jgi:hypothetical protein
LACFVLDHHSADPPLDLLNLIIAMISSSCFKFLIPHL